MRGWPSLCSRAGSDGCERESGKDVRRNSGGRAVRTKTAETLPKRSALCAQWKRCGKPACHCTRGELHGPYWCLFWRERGRLRKRYVRLADVEAVHAQLQE